MGANVEKDSVSTATSRTGAARASLVTAAHKDPITSSQARERGCSAVALAVLIVSKMQVLNSLDNRERVQGTHLELATPKILLPTGTGNPRMLGLLHTLAHSCREFTVTDPKRNVSIRPAKPRMPAG